MRAPRSCERRLGEQVALRVEARFQRVQARLQVVDAALEALDLVGVGADPGVQLVFASLRGCDPAFECASARAGGYRPKDRRPCDAGGEDDREREQTTVGRQAWAIRAAG